MVTPLPPGRCPSHLRSPCSPWWPPTARPPNQIQKSGGSMATCLGNFFVFCSRLFGSSCLYLLGVFWDTFFVFFAPGYWALPVFAFHAFFKAPCLFFYCRLFGPSCLYLLGVFGTPSSFFLLQAIGLFVSLPSRRFWGHLLRFFCSRLLVFLSLPSWRFLGHLLRFFCSRLLGSSCLYLLGVFGGTFFVFLLQAIGLFLSLPSRRFWGHLVCFFCSRLLGSSCLCLPRVFWDTFFDFFLQAIGLFLSVFTF